MSENLFYGFEDVSDDYDYGTEVYKDDIYEFHPNMQIPYKERQMLYIPKGLFEEKCHDIGGYMKSGKASSTKIKFNIQVTIHEDSFTGQNDNNKNINNNETINFTNNKTKSSTAKAHSTSDPVNNELSNVKVNSIENMKLNENTTSDNLELFSDEKDREEHIKNELENTNVFNNPYYIENLKKVFSNKDIIKNFKETLAFPIYGLKVRVYIFRCLNLTAQENSNSLEAKLAGYSAFCKANSFIEIKLGDNQDAEAKTGIKFINDLSSVVKDTLNPNFFKFYELDANLPQDWRIEISIKSQGTSDTLIGSTVIDLENRYLGDTRCREILKIKSLIEKYNSQFTNDIKEDPKAELNSRISALQLRLKELEAGKIPVEFRPLYKPNTATAQGIIEMLVEVLPKEVAKIKKPLKIEPPPPQEFELRLVIWETKNVFVPGKVISSLN